MKAKLIKKADGYVLGIEDKVGTKLIATNSEEQQKILDKTGAYCEYKLSLKNCQAIERGYDLDELFQREIDELMFTGNLEDPSEYRSGMYKGSKILLEILGDKKFTEEDVVKAIRMSQKIKDGEDILDIDNLFGFTEICTHNMEYVHTETEIIQSLQQTEWEVEVEWEMYDDPDFVLDLNKEMRLTPKILERPKLDSKGCLILKRVV